MSVDIDMVNALGIAAREGLEVADHVHDDEAEEHDPRDGNDSLLAKRTAIKRRETTHALPLPVGRHSGVYAQQSTSQPAKCTTCPVQIAPDSGEWI